jgi:hypothetical protein
MSKGRLRYDFDKDFRYAKIGDREKDLGRIFSGFWYAKIRVMEI